MEGLPGILGITRYGCARYVGAKWVMRRLKYPACEALRAECSTRMPSLNCKNLQKA